MGDEDLKNELERLRAENEALKRSSSKGLSLRVSQKGALSVYGLGRFPVTLYKEQWLRLLDMTEDIQAFIKQNETQLSTKVQKSQRIAKPLRLTTASGLGFKWPEVRLRASSGVRGVKGRTDRVIGRLFHPQVRIQPWRPRKL